MRQPAFSGPTRMRPMPQVRLKQVSCETTALNYRCRREQLFHARPIKHQNRKDPKHGSKGHEQAFHTGHYKAEGVALSVSDEPACHQNEDREGPPSQNQKRGHANEKPADEARRLLFARTKNLRREYEDQPHDEVNYGNAGKESR